MMGKECLERPHDEGNKFTLLVCIFSLPTVGSGKCYNEIVCLYYI